MKACETWFSCDVLSVPRLLRLALQDPSRGDSDFCHTRAIGHVADGDRGQRHALCATYVRPLCVTLDSILKGMLEKETASMKVVEPIEGVELVRVSGHLPCCGPERMRLLLFSVEAQSRPAEILRGEAERLAEMKARGREGSKKSFRNDQADASGGRMRDILIDACSTL